MGRTERFTDLCSHHLCFAVLRECRGLTDRLDCHVPGTDGRVVGYRETAWSVRGRQPPQIQLNLFCKRLRNCNSLKMGIKQSAHEFEYSTNRYGATTQFLHSSSAICGMVLVELRIDYCVLRREHCGAEIHFTQGVAQMRLLHLYHCYFENKSIEILRKVLGSVDISFLQGNAIPSWRFDTFLAIGVVN